MPKSLFSPEAFLLQNKQQIADFIAVNPEFLIVLNHCINDELLLKEFSKLTKIEIPKKLSPIEKMIDEATGHNPDHDEFCLIFIGFIHLVVWQTMTTDARKEVKEVYRRKMNLPL